MWRRWKEVVRPDPTSRAGMNLKVLRGCSGPPLQRRPASVSLGFAISFVSETFQVCCNRLANRPHRCTL